MNQIRPITCAALILCSLSSASVFAQAAYPDTAPDNKVMSDAMDYNPSWYITPSLNMLIPDPGFGVSNHGEGAGLLLGKPVMEDWDIQIGTKYGRQNANGMKYKQNMLGVDALYMFSRKAIRPFVFFGVGAQEDRLNTTLGQQSGYAPYVDGGIGLQAVLSDQWSLQLDFRREHGYLKSHEFPIQSNGNNYLSLGISYAFDKSPTVAVAKAVPPPEPAPVTVTPVAPTPPAPPPPPPAPRFEKVVMSSTELFGFDKSELIMPQPKLDDIAQMLNKNTQVNHVAIVGYTDRIGSKKYNLKLSERRATAVKDYLITKGVAADRLYTEGKGEADPLVTCTDKKRKDLIVCLEPNRRVEVEPITVEQRVPAGR